MLTEAQVRDIALETYEYCMECINHFKSEHPTMTTIEVARFFNRGRDWVISRRNELGGYRINKRGDLRFKTDKVLDYKLKKQQLK